MGDTRLILHVKGTEQQITELPKQEVRAAISRGEITHSQLIWSVADKTWKQVRDLPHLWPSQKLAPAPIPRVKAIPTPRIVAVPHATAQGSAKIPAAHVAKPVPSTSSRIVRENHGFHPLKLFCIGLAIVVLMALGGNYLLVDAPLVSRLGQTPYAHVPVYAHLGGFMQPNVMVIHIPSSSALTHDNLTDFLAALARSTPEAPFGDHSFDRIALTSGWMGQYSFSGHDWKQLGEMEDVAQRKAFLLDQMSDAAGQPLLSGNSTLDEFARQAERDKIWAAFAAQFIRP